MASSGYAANPWGQGAPAPSMGGAAEVNRSVKQRKPKRGSGKSKSRGATGGSSTDNSAGKALMQRTLRSARRSSKRR